MINRVFTIKCSKCKQQIQPLVPVLIEVGDESTAIDGAYALEWCTSCRAQYINEFLAASFETAHALETQKEHDDFMDHLLYLYPQHKEQIMAHWLPTDCFEA